MGIQSNTTLKTQEIAFQGFQISNISRGSMPPDPPRCLDCIISNMKTCKSAGIDKISVKLIQAAGRTILNSLKNIFNLPLNTGIFSDDWKIARVTPIFKSNSKTDCGNYRPISIISNVAQMTNL